MAGGVGCTHSPEHPCVSPRPVGYTGAGFEPNAPGCKAGTPPGSPWLSGWGVVCSDSCRGTPCTISLAGPANPSGTLQGQEVGQTQGSLGPLSQDQAASLSQPRLTCQLRAAAFGVVGWDYGALLLDLTPPQHKHTQFHAPVKPRTSILTGVHIGLGDNLPFSKYLPELGSHPPNSMRSALSALLFQRRKLRLSSAGWGAGLPKAGRWNSCPEAHLLRTRQGGVGRECHRKRLPWYARSCTHSHPGRWIQAAALRPSCCLRIPEESRWGSALGTWWGRDK